MATSRETVDRAHAPVLFFGDVSRFGRFTGVVTVTLSDGLARSVSADSVQVDPTVEADLHTGLQGAVALREALDRANVSSGPAETHEN